MQVSPAPNPWQTNFQRQQQEAFDQALGMSADQLRALRPPLPQIQWLPPRFGYPGYIDRQWSVMQVFGIDRTPSGNIPGIPQMRQEDRVDYSKSQSTTQGSDRNTLGQSGIIGGG